jgi:hypothetical protein
VKPLALAVAFAIGCATIDEPPADLPAGAAGLSRWREARSEVRALQARFEPEQPYSMNVALDLTQPQLGQRMRARGAVAVRPPDALRMILLGPGGTTALDLWICGDRFRFAVPAIDLERRGDGSTPPDQIRGLPVDFLRWWFLRPFHGRLLSFDEASSGRRYVLRDAAQIIHLRAPHDRDHGLFTAARVSLDDRETLEVDGSSRCGDVRYTQRSTGIDIAVRCEQVNDRAPPDRAFADPDDPEAACGGQP